MTNGDTSLWHFHQLNYLPLIIIMSLNGGSLITCCFNISGREVNILEYAQFINIVVGGKENIGTNFCVSLCVCLSVGECLCVCCVYICELVCVCSYV